MRYGILMRVYGQSALVMGLGAVASMLRDECSIIRNMARTVRLCAAFGDGEVGIVRNGWFSVTQAERASHKICSLSADCPGSIMEAQILSFSPLDEWACS